jgi:hypothetical protein
MQQHTEPAVVSNRRPHQTQQQAQPMDVLPHLFMKHYSASRSFNSSSGPGHGNQAGYNNAYNNKKPKVGGPNYNRMAIFANIMNPPNTFSVYLPTKAKSVEFFSVCNDPWPELWQSIQRERHSVSPPM